jgi:signal transduction histidine kinase
MRWKVVRDKERLRTAIAADLHDEIGSLLGGIMSQAQLADIVPEKIPQIIDKIKISSKKGLESLSDIVWSIDQHHDHWQGLFERMEAHGQEVARTKGWIFSFVVTGTVPEGPMPQLVRQNMWMMFKEMVHNSAKHAQATRVANNIHVDLTGRISWTYADNGPGFDFDRSYAGNGIKNLKMRAQKMKAEFFYTNEGVEAAYHIIIY